MHRGLSLKGRRTGSVVRPIPNLSGTFSRPSWQSEQTFDTLVLVKSSPSDPTLVVTDAMIAVDHELTHLPAKSALQLIEFCRRRLAATEARVLADRYEAGASDRDVEDMAAGSDGKTSKAQAKRTARRAKATNANPGLADRLAKGSMSTEQADIIADAAADTDGEAACDEALIDSVSSTNPEQGKKKARSYVNERTDADDVQKRHDRQNRRRGVYRHRLDNGNAALVIHGSDAYIDEMERNIHVGSDVEYEDDGGRGIPASKHPRTRDQRNFDAARKLLCGTSAGKDAPKKAAYSASPRKATIFITATVDQLTSADPSPITGIDGNPLPRSLIEEIAGNASFIAQIFSKDGELLWQGREHRLATPAQINGLISRDKGCVQCGAPPDRCVAHHLLPWESPRRGPTNINNLVLLCTDCHTRLHRAKRTMFYDIATRTWRVRPATADEVPPDGRPSPDRAPPGKYDKPRLWERQPKPGIRNNSEAGQRSERSRPTQAKPR